MEGEADYMAELPYWSWQRAQQDLLWATQTPEGRQFVTKTVLGFYLLPGLGDAWLDAYFDGLIPVAPGAYPEGWEIA